MNTEISEKIKSASAIVIDNCLALKPGEKLLIISNPDTEQEIISRAIMDAAIERGNTVQLLLQPVKSQSDFAEDYVIDAIEKSPQAILSLSSDKLGKDERRLSHPLLAQDGKKYDHIFNYLLSGMRQIRAIWSPGISLECFTRTIGVDYGLMRKRAAALAAILNQAATIKVRSPGGTDIQFSVEGRKAHLDDGDFSLPGKGGNLPAGEVFVSPALRSAEGRIAFEGSMADIADCMVLGQPILCSISQGYVLDCEGGAEAAKLESALRKGMDMASSLVTKGGIKPEEALRYATNARQLGEFGIGLNEAARIQGKMLEDEKVLGTCHFAIGFNYEEDAPAMIHLDGLVQSPTVIAAYPSGQEILLMDTGKLALGF